MDFDNRLNIHAKDIMGKLLTQKRKEKNVKSSETFFLRRKTFSA